LPGYYELYNGLMMNDFCGSFLFYPVNDADAQQVCAHDNASIGRPYCGRPFPWTQQPPNIANRT
ncbi:MAG: hypothetical protein B7X06_03060, partial [Verrucomicrobia bacterium 21-51-4]